ncbi:MULTISPECIES: tetratricopeptide repeat protein [unclassified Pseudoalteromonas]|uniref:tetratricopeptide repeat protein n=1 Tax=unclassified Pseudoalteromonas TaxID=194690 RepID=UPI0006CA451F|nr:MULTISPECIES: SEL1-like repeat protein [unclassified Pseudoalteromonas]KPZ66959.1 Sel1 repeat protein [Pseudoalteromonas sp. P1-26]
MQYKTALAHYKKSSHAGGYPESQHNVGVMYEKVQGVAVYDKQAFYWYTKAVKQGYASSQVNLGFMYNYGKGVKQDFEQKGILV